MYCVQKNTRNAKPFKKSLDDKRPATGLIRNLFAAEDNLKYPAVVGLRLGHSHNGASFAPWRTTTPTKQ